MGKIIRMALVKGNAGRKSRVVPEFDISKSSKLYDLPDAEKLYMDNLLKKMKESRLSYFIYMGEYYRHLMDYKSIAEKIRHQKTYQKLFGGDEEKLDIPNSSQSIPLITQQHLSEFKKTKKVPRVLLKDSSDGM